MVWILMAFFCIGIIVNMLGFPYSLLGNFIMLLSLVACAALGEKKDKQNINQKGVRK